MNYWIIKFAPFRRSWKEILLNGKFEIYSVRNPQARNNLKEMKLGDPVLFYHSQEELAIMGKMVVIEEAHQDKTTSDTRWVSVIFEPIDTFQNPIYLQTIKENEHLQNIGLIKQPRLSVIKLSKEEFEMIIQIS
jgi:predicted RNA-binding protein with PUA-like domain